jgi:hypothetical protein
MSITLLFVNDSLDFCSNRQQGIHRWTTTSFGYVLLWSTLSRSLNSVVVTLQETANEINKMKRSLLL